MKIKVLLLYAAISLLINPQFLLAKQVGDAYFWLAEKQGKKIYLLGTVHFGVALEDLTCSREITNQLITSGIVFVEQAYPITLLDVMERHRKGHISKEEAKEEYRKAINDLPEEERQMIEQRRLVFFKWRHGNVKYNGNEGFEDLSPTTQAFLIDKGINLHGDYVDYMLALYNHEILELIFTFIKKLDSQINKIALSYDIPVQPLDDSTQMLEDTQPFDTREISRLSFEKFVAEYNQNLENTIARIKSQTANYKNPKPLSQEQITVITQARAQMVQFADNIPLRIKAMSMNRNERWVHKLNDISSDQNSSIFLAVGLTHLADFYNVIDMLKQDNYSVKRMNANCNFSGVL